MRSVCELRNLPGPVWLLGWVSLFTDAATEGSIRSSRSFSRPCSARRRRSGIIEGAAEAANSLLKIVAGRVADRRPKKRPLVLLGYAIVVVTPS
jgi:hypothetical protein